MLFRATFNDGAGDTWHHEPDCKNTIQAVRMELALNNQPPSRDNVCQFLTAQYDNLTFYMPGRHD